MVLCIIGLILFPILGLFSAKYRELAKESFRCVFRMATFRPCEYKLDQRIKSRITAKLMKTSPAIAKIVYKNFTIFSWILVLLFFVSIYGIGSGVYNYVIFGNCNGPVSSAFCVFKEIGDSINGMTPSKIDITGHPMRGNPNASTTIIEFACLQCPYSKEAEPALQKIMNDYPNKANLVFFFFPLPQHKNGILAAKAAYCADKQEKFWEYHDMLFEYQNSFDNSVTVDDAKASMISHATHLQLNVTRFEQCLDSEEVLNKVMKDIEIGKKLGLKGTPTFFINGKELVGPQPYNTFKNLIINSFAPIKTDINREDGMCNLPT